jgi:hypothetical protein
MTFSMQSLLTALSSHSAKLVGPAALERLDRFAKDFPPIGSSGAFELHLGTGADRADLLVFSDGQGGRRKLSRALAQGAPRLAGPALRPLLEEWTLPGALLSARTSLLWLEYDLPRGGEGRPPMVYFGLLGLAPAELGDLVQRTRRILTGRAAGEAQIRTLERCMQSLPDDGQITFLADPCAARGVDSVRLIAQVPRVHAWSWLERVGWPGSRDQWEAASSTFTNGPTHISLYLDVADTVGPTLGVESTLPPPDSGREQWERLAERLVDLGATTAEEVAAVISWAGSETVDLPGIESLVRLSRMPSFKLVVDARGGISAKGYLGFRARETLF